uniref:Uncharacterized protein n=1 Tax=Curvibacter symbiont subsp. Hydra magnipapillata TaxID=667019 RepID=C9YFE9_CURXX|nr:hypothetical protein Csp_D33050 [Curvibacter putative symbiont of Hydra magnipapillata]
MARDYSAYERESYGWIDDKPPQARLSPELLGCMLMCAWRATADSLTPDDEIPVEQLLQGIVVEANPPGKIASTLHLERRIDGPLLQERTQIVAGAQNAGIVSRMNPSNVKVIARIDSMQASLLLKQYAVDFPDEVAWVEQLVEKQLPTQACLPA